MPHDIGPDGTDGWDGQHLSACRWVGRTAPPFKGAVPSVRPNDTPQRPNHHLSGPIRRPTRRSGGTTAMIIFTSAMPLAREPGICTAVAVSTPRTKEDCVDVNKSTDRDGRPQYRPSVGSTPTVPSC
jgi:hypothetical protein